MYAFTGLPAISPQDLTVSSTPLSTQQLSRDAFLGSHVVDARRNRREASSLRLGKHRSVRFLSLLTAR